MKKKRILITGIPGTGKTKTGGYFQSQYGYTHINLEEQDKICALIQDPNKFIEQLLIEKKNVIVTWGFLPEEQGDVVKLFKENGFLLVWFDGNRPAALREFIKRGTVSTNLFELQMERITSSNIVRKINPIIINTFNEKGIFKKQAQIAREIISKL